MIRLHNIATRHAEFDPVFKIKIAATRAADNGATVAQLNAIFGWTGSAMASLYTQEADRRRLAIETMHKLANDDRTSIPSPL